MKNVLIKIFFNRGVQHLIFLIKWNMGNIPRLQRSNRSHPAFKKFQHRWKNKHFWPTLQIYPFLWRLTQDDVCCPIKPKMRVPFAAQSSRYTAREINEILVSIYYWHIRVYAKNINRLWNAILTVISLRVIIFKVLVHAHLWTDRPEILHR